MLFVMRCSRLCEVEARKGGRKLSDFDDIMAMITSYDFIQGHRQVGEQACH